MKKLLGKKKLTTAVIQCFLKLKYAIGKVMSEHTTEHKKQKAMYCGSLVCHSLRKTP